MTTPETATTLSIHSRVRFRRVLDEAVVIHQERAEALVLNDTATAFLELCNGERSLEEIVGLMADQYEVEPATLLADMIGFAQELVAEGIIDPV